MKVGRRLPLVLIALSLMVLGVPPLAGAQRAEPGGAPPPGSGPRDVAGFVRVIDGDTVETYIDGKRSIIGLVGIDAPEANTPCGKEAKDRLQDLVRGGLHLEEDDEVPAFDDRTRRMYQVKAPDGRTIGEELVRAGLARADGRGKERQQKAAAEAEARAANRGCIRQSGRAADSDGVTLAMLSLSGAARGDEMLAAVAIEPAAMAVAAAPAAATVPSNFTEDVVASGLTNPTAFAFLPDGRILIAQQNGVVRIYKNGALLPTPFIDIQDRVNDYVDHGLLGIAADPSFATNGYVYLLYTFENNATDYSGLKTGRLDRYTAIGDTASRSSQVPILGKVNGAGCPDPLADCIPSEYASHSVGNVKFAADGSLFLTSGDGASFNTVDDRALRSQSLDSLGGKVIRINPDGTGRSDNPFWTGNANANKSKVWASGLRNPYRFNLRPNSNTPYVGDVGWNNVEEVSVAARGVNMGWPCYEGDQQQSGYASKSTCVALYAQGSSAVEAPLVAWPHNDGGTCCGAAATGGPFYTGTAYPSQYQGAYFYAEYAKGWIRYLRVDADDDLVAGSVTGFATNADGPVDVELGPDQNLYYLAINTNQLRRIRYTGAGNRPPTAVAAATPTDGLAPLAVQFSSGGSFDPDADPLQYTWSFGDGQTSNLPNPQHTYTANGTYTATLTLDDGRGGTGTETARIDVGNRAPTATITAPASSLTYKVGDVINYAGSATDADGGTPGLSWEIIIQHCPGGACHEHTQLTASGPSGTFTIPDHGDESHFEIRLTATDSGGLIDTASVMIQPQALQITLATAPSGLQVIYDGQTGLSPMIRTTVPGSTHTIEAPDQGGYRFASWSDGGSQQHDVTVGNAHVTFTASFSQLPTVTFDDKAGQDQALNGQYPAGVIDWGTDKWYHSGPWGLFATKSIAFNGSGPTSATFSFVAPRRLINLEAYNGGGGASTVTLSCAGQPNKQTSVPAGQVVTITTGWTGTCTTVTVASSNGWDTNFDTLVHDAGSSSATATPTTAPATATPTPAGPTATATPAPPTATPTTAPATATPTSAAATATPTPGPATQTVTFDDKAGQDQALNGQYPAGVINWGTNKWYHAGPWGEFTTKSVGFNRGGVTSRTFSFVAPRRLVSLQAYNGGGGATTVTLSCAGQPNKQASVPAGQVVTITTGWTGTCTTVTVASSNGWDTNFDTLVHAGP